MVQDKHGNELKVGDKVVLVGEVTNTSEGELSNMTVKFQFAESAKVIAQYFTCDSRQAEKSE